MSRLRPGAVIEVEIDKGVYRGLGLARHEGQVVFVPRTFPGERVRARVERVTAGFLNAALQEILAASPDRRAAPCPSADRCGGCAYQELDYGAQLRLKGAILRETLERGAVPWKQEIPLFGSPEKGWRVRCAFHVETTAARAPKLGLKEEGGRRVVDLLHCAQLSDGMNAVLRDVRMGLERAPDLARHIRGIELAESLAGDRQVACFDTELDPHRTVALASLGTGVPGLTGLGASATRDRFVPLRGEPYVETEIRGIRFRCHIRSFFQANRFLVSRLVDETVGRIPPGGTVLDLYAGVGLFALSLADRVERVLGAELNPHAVEDARANTISAGVKNVLIQESDVGAALSHWPVDAGERVVLDPPRTGTEPEIVEAIASRRPDTVVYVSCDPPTLARDLKLFATSGYRPASIVALDLFPDTYHLETVVQLLPG